MASQELRAFLSSVDSRYMGHADAIHNGQFTSKAELAAADRSDLVELGIPKGAAGAIIAAARGKGLNKLTLLQVLDSTAQPFKYAIPPSTSTTLPKGYLRHVPDQVLPWLRVEEEALAFRESLPATPAIYEAYVPTTMQPTSADSALVLMDGTFFPVVNQLGHLPGFAAMKFNEIAKGLKLGVVPDRVWMCNGKVIGVAEGKQPLSRPTLLGHGLLKQYKPDKPMGKATAQLQQVCGQLHHNCLKYAVLYTDECFWFLQYDSANGLRYVSEGIKVSQKQPTVFTMLLFVGHLAQQHADTTPPLTCRQSLSLMLAFWGNFGNMAVDESAPDSVPLQLRMGPLLGQGSTDSVRFGRIGDEDVAVKLVEEADDQDSAVQRLQHELDLYQDLLLPLQGNSVPRLMASGTVAGTRLPFLALDLLPVSLADVQAHLGVCECQHVLEALNSIHQQGVLHGDIEPRHVVYSSHNTLAQPKWIDFSNARLAQSSKELADEVNKCQGMLQRLHRACSRPNQLRRPATSLGISQAVLQSPCRSHVMTSWL